MTAPRKTMVETTADGRVVGELIPQPHGGALRNGGTNRGGPGRPRNEHRELLRGILDSPAHLEAIRQILEDKDHPAFVAVLSKVLPYVLGAPRASELDEDQRPLLILDL